MRPDFILKNVMVYQTFRQCFEKRDVAVAGEKFYCISPAISYPGVEERDGKGRYMLPGLVDIHVNIDALPSSNADLMLDTTFESAEALKGYSTHPAHVAVANSKVRPYYKNRVCLDYEV